MKRHSFFLRLFVGNLVIVVVAVVVAAVVSYRAVDKQHRQITEAYQDNLCLLAVQHLQDLWPLSDGEVDRLCKRFLETLGGVEEGDGPTVVQDLPARLTVIARDGHVLGDSRAEPDRMENHLTRDRPEVVAAVNGRPGSDVRRSETLAIKYRYVARPLHHEGHVVGAVRVATPVTAILESQAVLSEGILWGAILAVGAFTFIGLLINWLWYAPLNQITQAARQIASGDLSKRAGVRGSAELAELGAALNAMRDSIARQIATVSAQRENLQQVIGNLRDGVIATDDDGNIVLMNRAARRLLAHEHREVVGRHIQEVVRVADIADAYSEAVGTGDTVSCQVECDVAGERRHLDVHASPLAEAPDREIGCLVVIRDVTDLVRAAAMKAEFVANASHELRTPLATLRMAVESLEEEEEQAQGVAQESFRHTLDILARHVERLESLTMDMLDLHAVETTKRLGKAEAISVASLADWVRNQFADTAADKGVAFDVVVADTDDGLTADRRLIELVLQNLIDNAVKFTEEGGRVSCSIHREDGQMHFEVADTGRGIPRADQARIFERFYQVDTSRAGDTKSRGTGLGLAIVKHAVERLGGSVSLESEPGRGTTVSVFVPDWSQEPTELPGDRP